MFFALYLILSFSSFLAFRRLSGDTFNPAGIFLFFWYLCCAISNLYLSDLQEVWPLMMHAACILGGIAFGLGALMFYPRRKFTRLSRSPTNLNFRLLSRFIFVVSFICFLIEWQKNGFQLTILSLELGDLKGANQGIPFIHYGSILLPLCGVMAVYEWLNDGPKWSLLGIMVAVFGLYSFGVGLSRGDLLLYIGAALFLVSRYRRVNLLRLLLYAAVLVGVVIGVMMLRISDESSIVYNTTGNRVFSVFYSYIAINYENLVQLVKSSSGYHWAGNATLRPFWTAIGQKDNFPIDNYTTEDVFNAQTYLYGYYHDFKLIGAVVFSFLLGGGLGFLYKVTVYSKYRYYLIILAVLQKAIYFSFFGDYFISDLVIIWPYLIATIVAWLSRKDLVLAETHMHESIG